MDQRKRNAIVAVVVLIVVPVALILLWRAWGEPGVLVSYTRSGGLAGVTERTVVYRDGRVLFRDDGADERESTLSDPEHNELETVLASGEWPSQPTVYGEPTMADGFQHDLTYDGHVVRAFDLVQIEWLKRVIDAVADVRGGA